MMLKYSTRANAHPACVLERCRLGKNFARFIAHVINLNEFPILMIRDDVPKLEALRDAFRERNFENSYAELCEEMIAQRIEELVEANRKANRWT